MKYSYQYPHPSVTVDCVVFTVQNNSLKLMLIQRGTEPFKGEWALPGGFVRIDEDIESAASRELKEETGIDNIFLEQLYTFGKVDRDPRERVISVAYYALVSSEKQTIIADTDAISAKWFSLDDLPNLAFDHKNIIETAYKRLQGKLRYQPIGFELLPLKFTLSQLQSLYEVILSKQLDKRNFRKKIQKTELLDDTNETQQGVSHRAAKLYTFNKEKYDILAANGYYFEI